MADVSIKIQLQDTIEDVIDGVSANQPINNVSSAVSKNTQKNDGTRLLSFAQGYLKFDATGHLINADEESGSPVLEGSYNGFVFGATNASGEYSVTLTITGSHIDSLIFYGDKLANQFATEAYLDGDTTNKIYSDDAIWAVKFSSTTSSHTITFTKWNRANYNACFTHIAVLTNELILNKKWLKDVESLSQITGQPNDISYGIISASGNISIVDRNGEIFDYIKDGIIQKNNTNFSLIFNGNVISNLIFSDFDYYVNSKNIKSECSDGIKIMGNVGISNNVNGKISTPLSFVGYQSLYDLIQLDNLKFDLDLSNNIHTYFGDKSISDYLKDIHLKNYIFDSNETLQDRFNSICQISQLGMYLNPDNKIKAIQLRPKLSDDDYKKIIYIPKKNQYSDLQIKEITNNKYNKVKIPEIVWTKEQKAFGSSYTISFQKISNYGSDNSASTYDEIYDTDENVFNGNTEIVEITSAPTPEGYTRTDYYYKTHVTFDLSGTLLPYNFYNNLYLYVKDVKKGLVTGQGSYYNKGSTETTYIANASINSHSGAIDNIHLSNNNNTIEFDYYVYKSNKSTTGGYWNFDLAPTIQTTIQLYCDVYSNTTQTLEIFKEDLKEYETLELQGNKFLTSETTCNGVKLSSIIADNILNDYYNGVSDGTITVCCYDYYYKNGDIAKIWANGEVLNVGDLICFEQYENRIFRITGCKYIYNGVEMIDLEFQEIKQ